MLSHPCLWPVWRISLFFLILRAEAVFCCHPLPIQSFTITLKTLTIFWKVVIP